MSAKPTYEELEQRIQELERINNEVDRISKDWYATFNSVNDAIWILDDKQHIQQCNRASELIFQRSSEEMIGQFCWEIVHGTDQPIPECPAPRALQSLKRASMELQIDQNWFQVTVDPILDSNGKYNGAVHIVRDITERKLMEKKLFESEKKYHNLFENGLDLLCIHDLEGNLLETNVSYKKQYGLENEDLKGLNIQNFIPDRYKVEFDQYLERIIQNKEDEGYLRVMTKSGKEAILEYRNKLIYDAEGRPKAVQGSARDVTSRLQAEKKLRESEEKFRLVTETIQDVFWISTPGVTKMVYISPTYEKIWGKSTQQLYESPRSFLEAIHPEDLEQYLSIIEAFHAKGKAYQCEYRILPEPASMLWIQERGYPITDDHGNTVLMTGLCADITDRKLAEEAAKVSEDELKLTLDATTDGIWTWNFKTDTLSFSPKYYKMLGYEPDEFTANYENWISLIHPDDREEALGVAEEFIKTKPDSYENEFRLKTKSGEYRWIRANAHVVERDEKGEAVYMIGNHEDITKRKLAEEALSESEEKYRYLVEESPFGIALISADGCYKYVNPKFVDIFGYHLEDIPTGKMWFKKAYPQKKYRHKVISTWINDQKDFPVGEARPRTFTVTCKDGTEKIINFKPVTMTTGDQFMICEDVTEAKHLEAQLHQAQKIESIGNLAGGIAHDFNNILSSIIGYTELALDDAEKGMLLEDNLREVYTAGLRARDLVKQILAFARQAEVEIKPIQVGQICKDAMNLLRSTIPTSILIRQNIESDSLIMGDSTLIHQIFMNLCTNAAQAMEEQGGLLEVSLSDTQMDSDFYDDSIDLKPGDYLKIVITDTGVGISPEVIDLIFEPYFTTKKPGEGTGMGLATVHGIVKTYKGEIKVESEVGKGTVFTVYLPVMKKRDIKEEYAPEDLPSGNERILLIDDEKPIVEMTRQILERQGYKVTIRTSSVEALELFKQKPDDFDLVITDMTMPNMTGDNLAVKLMKIRPDIPVILCTGYSKKISDERATEIGIKAFAYKPIAKQDLTKTVRKVLDKNIK